MAQSSTTPPRIVCAPPPAPSAPASPAARWRECRTPRRPAAAPSCAPDDPACGSGPTHGSARSDGRPRIAIARQRLDLSTDMAAGQHAVGPGPRHMHRHHASRLGVTPDHMGRQAAQNGEQDGQEAEAGQADARRNVGHAGQLHHRHQHAQQEHRHHAPGPQQAQQAHGLMEPARFAPLRQGAQHPQQHGQLQQGSTKPDKPVITATISWPCRQVMATASSKEACCIMPWTDMDATG